MKKIFSILSFLINTFCQAQIQINGSGTPININGAGTTLGITSIPTSGYWESDFTNFLLDEHDVNNVRLDGIEITKLQNGWLLAMYNVFGTGFGDQNQAQLGYKYSTDEGETWSARILLPQVGLGSFVSSTKQRDDGTIVILFVVKTSLDADDPRSYIGKIEMAADLSSFTADEEVTVNDGTTYLAPASNRIFEMPNGDWLYPYGFLISGNGNSVTSVYYGRMLKSADEGETWADAGMNVINGTNPGNIVTECGLFLKNDDNTLVYYFRAKEGYIKAVDITNFTSYEPGGIYALMYAPNSQSIIKQVEKNIYVAVHNRYADGIVGVSARKNMEWSVSSDGEFWRIASTLVYSYDGDEFCFEPCILVNQEKAGIMVGFSRYDGSTYSDVYTVIINYQDILNEL